MYQYLLVAIARCNGTRVLQEPVAEGALAMINVCHDAEVSVSVDRYGRNARFELGCRWLPRC